MKRRTFILGGGTLATLSLGATATNASLSNSVDVGGDFRILALPPDGTADLTADDTNEFVETVHTWTEMKFTSSGQNITRIEADYDFDGSGGFDTINEADTVIEFYSDRGSRFREADFSLENVNGATATFRITGGQEVIVDSNESTNVRIEIVDFENPESGSYVPELTFVREDGEKLRIISEFSTSTGAGQFNVTIIDAPSEITIGETISVTAEIENTGSFDSQDIKLFVGSQQDTRSVSLSNGETKTVDLESDPINEGGEVTAEVTSENDTAETTVNVVGGWGLNLDPATAGNKNSTHTWSTGGFEFEEGAEVNQIFFEYSDNNRGFRLDGLTANDVTVEMEVGNDDSLTSIGIDSVTSADSFTATVTLDPNADTTVGGAMNIVLDGVENINQAGEYESIIELDGGDSYDDTVTAVVE